MLEWGYEILSVKGWKAKGAVDKNKRKKEKKEK